MDLHEMVRGDTQRKSHQKEIHIPKTRARESLAVETKIYEVAQQTQTSYKIRGIRLDYPPRET